MSRTSHLRWLLTATCALLLLLAVGCAAEDADSGDASAEADTAPEETMTAGEGADDMADMEGMADEDDHGPFAFGEPAEAADADRTIEVEALDSLAYEPAAVEVAAGETITFVVTNSGVIVHEFVIGDAEVQEEHEAEMAEMAESGEMQMADEPNAISLDPGETKRITWRFAEGGELEFACHQPGHYAGGMVGILTVS